MNKATSVDINDFILDLRETIEQNKFRLIPRKSSIRTLSKLGITYEDAIDEIYNLTVDDYVKGPVDDYEPSEKEPVWIFKKEIIEKTIYIKLKVAHNKEGKAISFHFDNYRF